MIGTKFNKQAASTAPNRNRLPTVNCLHGVQVVGGSNPLAPTKKPLSGGPSGLLAMSGAGPCPCGCYTEA